MKRALLLAACVIACKGKHDGKPAKPRPSDAAPIVVDWPACEAALKAAAADPLDARPQRIIAGCKVCGDWTPLLDWSTLQKDHGPSRPAIEAAMVACNAFCDSGAKQRFLGTLDDTRGTNARTPWRWLGELCKDKVSAVPDTRYETAPYFALDRIGRAATQHGGEIANLVAAVELPLPTVSVTGAGIVLPDLDSGVAPNAGALAITLINDQIYVGKMPRARLGANGVTADLGPDLYPGKLVALAGVAAALTKLNNGDKTMPVMLLAPRAMPAQAVIPIVTAAAPEPVLLAANAQGSPEGWQLPGTIEIGLIIAADPPDPKLAAILRTAALVVTPEMTVQQLAIELAKRAAAHAPVAALRPPTTKK